MIYGGLDASGIVFDGIAAALAVPRSDLRLFGKPESFRKRRMGVAIANGDDVAQARERAKRAASLVRPGLAAVSPPMKVSPAAVVSTALTTVAGR